VLYQLAADFILLLHFSFIAFVVAGGLLVFKWRRLIWLHIPAVIWGALIVISGWICPLTPVENMLRQAGGAADYSGSFIEYYLVPVIYPSALNRTTFIAMGIGIIVINAVLYTLLFVKAKRKN
jgi:hypothetical protein